MENYNECYHCAGVHPELVSIVPVFKENGANGLDWEKGVPHRNGANTFTFNGTTNRDPFPGLNQSEKDNHFGQALYPNPHDEPINGSHCCIYSSANFIDQNNDRLPHFISPRRSG